MQNENMFFKIHDELGREAPGSDATTLKLLKKLEENGFFTKKRKIALDIGCGPGAGTKVLAQFLSRFGDWKIFAIDTHQPFLERTKRAVFEDSLNVCDDEHQVSVAVETCNLDMNDLGQKFELESVDLILAEGSAYCAGGIHEACNKWFPFLKQDGAILASELCWTSPKSQAAEEVKAFWDSEYPEMLHVDTIVESILFATPGYRIIDRWNSSQEDVGTYYEPMLERIHGLKQLPDLSAEDLDVLNQHEWEAHVWRLQSPSCFHYVQFVLEKDEMLQFPNHWRRFPTQLAKFRAALGVSEEDWKKPQKLLDVCCGKGEMSALFAHQGHQVVGIDLDISGADAQGFPVKFQKFNLKENDFLKILKPHSFDGLWCCFAAAYFASSEEELADFLGKLSSLVRPGGWLIIIEIDGLIAHHLDDASPWKSEMEKIEQDDFPKAGYDPFAGGKMKKSLASSPSFDKMEEIEIDDYEIFFQGEIRDAWACRSWEKRFDRPLKPMVEAMGEEKYKVFKDQFLKCIQAPSHKCDPKRAVKALLLRKNSNDS